MIIAAVSLLFGFSLIYNINVAVSQCSVNLRNDIPLRDPVYIKYNTKINRYDLWAPDGPALQWNSMGDKHLLTCSGSGNILLNSERITTETICEHDTIFSVNGTLFDARELSCRNTITGDTINTGTECPDGGTLLNLGFNTNTHGFITYIQSCYNMNTGSTLYTRHILPGRAINHAVIESSRPAFKTAGSAPHVRPNTAYTQVSQLARLTDLLGSAEQAARFVFPNSFMARGHLAPDADGIYRSWQFTTYFFTNVAPQWQATNNGNWLRVENAVRSKAAQMNEDLLIFTGTHGILTLPDINNNQVEITLEAGGNIEVPKYYWKIIKSEKRDSGIAMIKLNNPFAIELDEWLCTDICESSGWGVSFYLNFTRGRTYCCDVNDFMKTVVRAPKEATVSYVLKF